MEKPPPYAGPPWAGPGQWAEANAALLRLSNGPEMEAARGLAEELAGVLKELGAVMERLSSATCPRCLEPCCARARVWLDFTDLLFMHLSGQVLPLGQFVYQHGGACPHLGPTGCRLPRLSRPWVCTWHLCPEQKARMAAWNEQERRAVDKGLVRVKSLRAALEGAVAGHGPD